MRILHTSDWHLGQNFFDFDRGDEHACFLDVLYSTAKEKTPDVIVVSGDIFDVTAPSIPAQELYNERMIRLSELKIPIVVTAGNHDSASRLEVNGPLWNAFGLTVVGNLQLLSDGSVDADKHIVEIPGKGFVAAVPYIYKYSYPKMADKPDASVEERMECFHNTILRRVAERNAADLPVVMMAHTAVTGNVEVAELSERAASMEFYSTQVMGQGWDYLALGHIHRPSGMCNKRVRYCGSPIPLSFDETSPRSLSIVDIAGHGAEPQIELVEIPVKRKMLTIPAEPKPLAEAIGELARLDPDEDCYVRLNLLITDYAEGSTALLAANALQGKKARYCGTKITKLEATSEGTVERPVVSVANINNDPMAIAKMYYKQKYNTEMNDELAELLKQVIDETKNEIRL